MIGCYVANDQEVPAGISINTQSQLCSMLFQRQLPINYVYRMHFAVKVDYSGNSQSSTNSTFQSVHQFCPWRIHKIKLMNTTELRGQNDVRYIYLSALIIRLKRRMNLQRYDFSELTSFSITRAKFWSHVWERPLTTNSIIQPHCNHICHSPRGIP